MKTVFAFRSRSERFVHFPILRRPLGVRHISGLGDATCIDTCSQRLKVYRNECLQCEYIGMSCTRGVCGKLLHGDLLLSLNGF